LGSRRRAWFGFVAAVAFVVMTPALARDHDDARRAVERGEMRPLSEVLATARNRLPGDVVRVDIEQQNGRWYYEFRTVDAQGRLFEVLVDGRTGEIKRVKEK
jgi:uncharacterized membrane protein YkoI